MNSLLSGIESLVKDAFEEYINEVSSKHSIDKSELQELWNSMNLNMKITAKKTVEPKASKVQSNPNAPTCPYILKRGRVGEACGAKPCKGGAVYCYKHKKEEDKTPEPKPINKLPTTSRILKLNKEISKYVHAESGLYVVSKEDSTVVGSFRDGKQQEYLTSEDILLCEKYGFKYDASLLQKDTVDELEEMFDNLQVQETPIPVEVVSKPKKKAIILDEEPIKLKPKQKPVVDVKTIENAKKMASTILSTIPNSTELKEKKKIEDVLKEVQEKDDKLDSDSDLFTDDESDNASESELDEDI